MGQLEKYGLYVLCLVIFLILGVAIWGGDPAMLPQQGRDVSRLATNDPGKGKDVAKEQPREPKEVGNPAKDPGKDAAKEPPKTSPEAQKGASEGLGTMLAPHVRKPENDAKKEPAKDPAAKTPPDANAPKGDAAKPAPVPVEPTTRVYVVKDNDSLYRIAERELGSSARVPEIESLNPTIKRGVIRKGDQIKLPAAKAHEDKVAAKGEATDKASDKSAHTATPGSSYKVRQGDTLTSISRAAYGTDKHVRAILAANVGKVASANSIKKDMILALPAKPGT